METYLQPYLLLLVVPVVLVVALRAPVHWLLLLDLIGVALSGIWQIAGLRFDPSDVVLAAIGVRLLRNRRTIFPKSSPAIPYIKLWIILGVMLSIAYLAVPINQEYLTNPARAVYQVYRYCWKTILFYPLAVILLSDNRRFRLALATVVVAGAICSLIAVPQGYSGMRVVGPFSSGNELGAVLVVPLLTCVLFVTLPEPRKRVYFLFLSSLLLLVRALLFSESRGAQVAVATSVTILVWALLKIPLLRTRLRRFLVAIPLLALGLVILIPGLLERPNIRQMLSTSEGTKASTMTWRMETRWPHFWNIAVEHPWLGTGSEVDRSLGRSANTPHNGYLALAVRSGFPVLGMYLLAACLGLRDSVRAFRRTKAPELRALSAIAATALVAILLHNIVDSVFLIPFVGKLFWMMLAFAAVAAQRLKHASPSTIVVRATGSAQAGC